MAFAPTLTARLPVKRNSVSRCRQQLHARSRASSNGPEAPRPRAPEGNLLKQVKTGASHFSQVGGNT